MLNRITINQQECYNLWKDNKEITGYHFIVLEAVNYLLTYYKKPMDLFNEKYYAGITYEDICETIPFFPMTKKCVTKMINDLLVSNVFVTPIGKESYNNETAIYYLNTGSRQYSLSYGDPKTLVA